MRRPPVVLGMAALTCMALLVAVLLILFSVNPSVDRNEGEIRKAVMSQHAIICAQVQNTANAYRFRSLTPSGDVEPIRHFLTRMQAQQQTLRLARGSECRSAPGFPPVGLQVRRALGQIHRILQSYEPKLREPVRNGISNLSPSDSDKQGSFLPGVSRPPNAGIDESGVPAHLHPKLTPSAPVEPETGREPETKEPEAVPVEPMPQEPDGGAPGTNVAQPPEPERPSSSAPATVEAKLEPPEVKIELEIP